MSNVFSKFPRIVRDIARSCEKDITFKTEGEETELDRTIIEAIKDPLTHIVRNSVDHGIEKPAERRAAGKPESGTLLIRAFHEGGQVVIEIIDDGAGVSTDRVRSKALERGIITQAQAGEMTDDEINNLIMLPGFSTAEVVTNLSGRGVGMDVVKTNIEKIGGTVDLSSVRGEGTTLRISIPLTLAIVPALIVRAEGERFAIPQVNLQELVRLDEEEMGNQIERVAGAETYRLRGDLLPLLRLSEVLRLEKKSGTEERAPVNGGETHEEAGAAEADMASVDEALPAIGPQTEGDHGKQMNILVLVLGNTRYGLIVDRVHDIEEVVVKPLSKHLNAVSAYAGATILGDGKVILILDAYGLAEESGCRFDSTKESADRATAIQDKHLNEVQSLLLFTVAPEERFAIPLALISRLEKFKSSDINLAGGKEVIQYRGKILPLLRFEDHLPISRAPESGEDVNIIVFNFERNEVGLVVTEIVDVVEIAVSLDQSTFGHQGILGSSIVSDHTTLFLDIFSIVGGVFPTWFENRTTPMSTGDFAAEEYTILFAEDSQFFRTIVRSYLEAKNYTVIEAHDGQEALEMLESGAKVDLVLTDVEMPRLNGFELTEAIRASEKWSHLPIMALTSLASDEDRERGLKAGVNEYCVKLDRAEVLNVVDKLIKESAAAAV